MRKPRALLLAATGFLIALTTGKVFLNDVSHLGGSYRIVSFIALGAVLLGISFVYQRDWLKRDVYRLGVQLKGALTMTMIRTPPWVQVWEKAVSTGRTLQSVLSPNSNIGINKLSGPVGIGKIYWDAAQAGIRYVLWIAILVNVNLAIFNLLPIPVLDGGHMLFATIGKIRGRALPVNFIAAAQSIFIVLLFTMIIYVSVHDVGRIVRDNRSEAPAKPTAPEPAKTAEPVKP